MPTIIEYLESFNRKERFFLIGEALGNPDFQLGQHFRAKVNLAFGVQIPPLAFVAMDYHLDWIYTSLFMGLPGKLDTRIHPNTGAVTGTQEDVDLLVAYEERGITHLILLEAKVATGWTNKQMISKAKRLSDIFGADGSKYPLVKPHFGLMSPRCPQKLESGSWPSWMTRNGEPVWLELPMKLGRRRVTRCDGGGMASASGRFFRVSP